MSEKTKRVLGEVLVKKKTSNIKNNGNFKLFYIKNDKNSQLVIETLKSVGIEFNAIDVREYDLIHTLSRDIGTIRIPSLVSPDGTFVGLSSIMTYINKKL